MNIFERIIQADYKFDWKNILKNNPYYGNYSSEEEFEKSNTDYNSLSEEKKKEIQALGKQFAQQAINKNFDLEDMVLDFSYDNQINIPRGKFPEIFGLTEKQYNAIVEKEHSKLTGPMIGHYLFDESYPALGLDKKQPEDWVNLSKKDVEEINRAIDEYLNKPLNPVKNTESENNKYNIVNLDTNEVLAGPFNSKEEAEKELAKQWPKNGVAGLDVDNIQVVEESPKMEENKDDEDEETLPEDVKEDIDNELDDMYGTTKEK